APGTRGRGGPWGNRRPPDLPVPPRPPRRGGHLRASLAIATELSPFVPSKLALELGLTVEEYERIVTRLGRRPTYAELGLFSALWSEHCAYKHSRIFLRRPPPNGPAVLQGPG